MSDTTPEPAAPKKCSYEHWSWHCPFDAEEGLDLCIFHLPVDKKKPEGFWRHLASLLSALADHAGSMGSSLGVNERAPLLRVRDAKLVAYYKSFAPTIQYWFLGFRFPPMVPAVSLSGLALPRISLRGAVFTGNADFRSVRFADGADFTDTTFSGEAVFTGAAFGAWGSFSGASFNARADFGETKFGARGYFRDAVFSAEANFAGSVFSAEAHFGSTTFGAGAYFQRAVFNAKGNFRSAKFMAEAYFTNSVFRAKADFEGAAFGAEADFTDATFSGPAYFARAKVSDLLGFVRLTLRNRLLFEGTVISDTGRILFWGLDFVHGTSDILMEKGHERGLIVEPAGQVVFRDISSGINQVSFLHTDILTDRLCVRFSNVKWKRKPMEFLFDAKFAFCRRASEWQAQTRLAPVRIALLPVLFSTEQQPPKYETAAQTGAREAREIEACLPLVKQDVERIAREIRLSHERYGNYPDAGNYYVAEMNFRRARLPRRAWLKRPAMWFYWLVSRYGESPTRAGIWLLVWLALASWVQMHKGFELSSGVVRRSFALDFHQFYPTVRDFGLSLLYTFPKLVPFWSRPAGNESSGVWTAVAAGCQIVFYAILTLFLLAIRRRFRR